jgi:acyl-CoA synthetase (AMP-forming)/AMP-acid ligase II
MNATRKIGAIAVPLNYRLTPQEALYVINHSDAEVAYVDYEHVPMFAALRGQLAKVRHIIAVGGPIPEAPEVGQTPDGMLTGTDIAAAPAKVPGVGAAAGAGGTMIYTSGTTGKPKGAFRAGPADPEVLGALLNLFGYRPDDIYLTSGPLYHSGPSAFMGAGLPRSRRHWRPIPGSTTSRCSGSRRKSGARSCTRRWCVRRDPR